jgi:broad specificity phosphatase PhoE
VAVILLIRHAQASYGAADYDVLSDVGERQAQVVHDSLEARGIRPDRLVAGAMRRQRDTALPWTRAGGELETDARWDEYDSDAVLRAHGQIPASLEAREGAAPLTSREFQTLLDPAVERWIESAGDAAAPGTWTAFREGAVGALRELAETLGRGQTAFVFSSSGVIAACAAAVLGLPDLSLVPLNRVAINTGITKVISGGRGLSLISYNEHGHLEADGLVTYR